MAKINHVIINRLGYNRKWDMTWAEKGLIYRSAVIKDFMLINMIKAYFVQYSTPLFTHKFLRNKKGDGKNKSAKKNILNNQFIDMNMNYSHLDIRRNPYLGLNCYFMDSLIEEWRLQYNNRIPKTSMYYMRERIARKRAILKASPKAYREIKPLFTRLKKRKLLSKQQRLFRRKMKRVKRKRIAKNLRKFPIVVKPYENATQTTTKLTKIVANLANKIQRIRFKKSVVYLPTNQDKRVKRNVFRRRKGRRFKRIWVKRKLKNKRKKIIYKKIRRKYNVKKKFPKLFRLYLGEKLIALKRKLKKRFKFKHKKIYDKPKIKKAKQELKITFTLSPKIAKNSLIKHQFINPILIKNKFSRSLDFCLIVKNIQQRKLIVSNANNIKAINVLSLIVARLYKKKLLFAQFGKKPLLLLKTKNNKKKSMFKCVFKTHLNRCLLDNKVSKIKRHLKLLRLIYDVKKKPKHQTHKNKLSLLKKKKKRSLSLKKPKILTKKRRLKRKLVRRYYNKTIRLIRHKRKFLRNFVSYYKLRRWKRKYNKKAKHLKNLYNRRLRKRFAIQRRTRRYPLSMFDSLLRKRRTLFLSPTENLFLLLFVLLVLFSLCAFMDANSLSFFVSAFSAVINELFSLPFYIVKTNFMKGLNLLHIKQVGLVTNVQLIQKLITVRTSFFNKVTFSFANNNFLMHHTPKLFVGFGGMHTRNTNARFINNYFVLKLGQYIVMQDILRPVLFDLKVSRSVLAFFICIAGRLTRKERASYSIKQHGNITFGTKDCSLDANCAFKILRFGLAGLKTVLNMSSKNVKPIAYKINTFISNKKRKIGPKVFIRYYTNNKNLKIYFWVVKRNNIIYINKRFVGEGKEIAKTIFKWGQNLWNGSGAINQTPTNPPTNPTNPPTNFTTPTNNSAPTTPTLTTPTPTPTSTSIVTFNNTKKFYEEHPEVWSLEQLHRLENFNPRTREDIINDIINTTIQNVNNQQNSSNNSIINYTHQSNITPINNEDLTKNPEYLVNEDNKADSTKDLKNENAITRFKENPENHQSYEKQEKKDNFKIFDKGAAGAALVVGGISLIQGSVNAVNDEITNTKQTVVNIKNELKDLLETKKNLKNKKKLLLETLEKNYLNFTTEQEYILEKNKIEQHYKKKLQVVQEKQEKFNEKIIKNNKKIKFLSSLDKMQKFFYYWGKLKLPQSVELSKNNTSDTSDTLNNDKFNNNNKTI